MTPQTRAGDAAGKYAPSECRRNDAQRLRGWVQKLGGGADRQNSESPLRVPVHGAALIALHY